MHFIALVMEVKMSSKSFACAVILFIVILLQSVRFVSGVCVKNILNDAETQIIELYPEGFSGYEARSVILYIHPRMSNLLDDIELEAPIDNGSEYFETLYKTTNTYLWKRTGYLAGALLIFGVPSFLFAERRNKNNSQRRRKRGPDAEGRNLRALRRSRR